MRSVSLGQALPPNARPLVEIPQGDGGGRGDGAGPEDADQAEEVVQDERQDHAGHDAVEQAGAEGKHGVARAQGQGVVDHEAGVENLTHDLAPQVLQGDGQELGMRSYGACVDLLVEEFLPYTTTGGLTAE